MKILLAIDGSAHSAAALEDIAARQWPPGTEVKVLTIVHSTTPLILDPAFVIAAVSVDTTRELRRLVPELLAAATKALEGAADAACAVDIIRAGRQAVNVHL